MLNPAEIGKNFLLRLFAHRAGVEDDEVGIVRICGPLQSFRLAHDVHDFVGIVLVHLATERAQEQLRHCQSRLSGCEASDGVRIQICRTMPSGSTMYFASAPGGMAAGTMIMFEA